MSVLVNTLSSSEKGGSSDSNNNNIKTDFYRHKWPSDSKMNSSVGWFLIVFSLVGIISLVLYSKDFLQFAQIVTPQQEAIQEEPVKSSDLTPLKQFLVRESVRVRPIVSTKEKQPVEHAKNTEQTVETDDAKSLDINGLNEIIARMSHIEESLENIKDTIIKDTVSKVSPPPAKISPPKMDNSAKIDKKDKKVVKKSRRLEAVAIRQNLADAYTLFLQGDTKKSAAIYNSVLRQNMFRREALMGLASIAVHNRQFEEARQLYKRILFLNPKDKEVLSRLISLREMDDPIKRVSQLKNMLSVEPDNFNLHFILGTIYIEKEQWPDAKEAFMQAHILERDHPDAVYNLAVSLEHIKQTDEALKYYVLAEELAKKNRAKFNLNQVKDRIEVLRSYFAQYDEPGIVLSPDGQTGD
ncbi:MAG: tetratricopeptide repeat protein [Magnetococcales bacterium]|nr:tetratricopeptide repeat protein [Magnetococcales bacterium]